MEDYPDVVCRGSKQGEGTVRGGFRFFWLLGVLIVWSSLTCLSVSGDECPGFVLPNEGGVREYGRRVPRALWPPGSPLNEVFQWADWVDPHPF